MAGSTLKAARPTDHRQQSFCLTIKGLFDLPLRQTHWLRAEPDEAGWPGWPVPDYSTVCRRPKTLTATTPDHPSLGSLHFLVDSTNLKILGEGELRRKKHGAEYHRWWEDKVYFGIDAEIGGDSGD